MLLIVVLPRCTLADHSQHVKDRLADEANVFFTGKGDRDDVIRLLNDYDKKMKHALNKAKTTLIKEVKAKKLGMGVDELE